jgi:two-component system NtrC family response regulator
MMEKPKLLIVEDEEVIRSQMKWALADSYDILTAGERNSALEILNSERPSLILLDLGLPPHPRTAEEGLKTLDQILAADSEAKIIVVTGNSEKEAALKAIDRGAFDFFLKPPDMQEVKIVLKRALNILTLERENLALKEKALHGDSEALFGDSSPMQPVYSLVRKVATTDVSVLITGESGTGKELVAREIHRLSQFREGPFIAINCGAIPEALLESELFGHEKGSFTGADAQRKGKIEHAAGGTLFLDEIGELPLLLQVKLLRFLQEYAIERVGGRGTIPVSVRVIAATNRTLEAEIKEGRFREDLYYRLGVVTIKIPPLRERGNDVTLLAEHFLKKAAVQYGRPITEFSAEALDSIRAYGWPGNVRELENKIRRAIIMSENRRLIPSDLNMPDSGGASKQVTLKNLRDRVEQAHIRKVLEKNNWNISKAAGELDVSRPTLHDLIKRHGIKKER